MRKLSLLLLAIISIQTLNSQVVHQKKFATGKLITLQKNDKKYILKYNLDELSDKIKQSDEEEQIKATINNSIKNKLLKDYPNDGEKLSEIIDFAEKFAIKSVTLIKTSENINKKVGELKFSDRYQITQILTSDKGHLYSFIDSDPDGNKPTILLYKTGSGYDFIVDSITQSSEKDSITKNFRFIYDFYFKKQGNKIT